MEYRLRKTRLRKLGNKEVSESKEVMVSELLTTLEVGASWSM